MIKPQGISELTMILAQLQLHWFSEGNSCNKKKEIGVLEKWLRALVSLIFMTLFQQQWIKHFQNIVQSSATEGTANTKMVSMSTMKIKGSYTNTESLERSFSNILWDNADQYISTECWWILLKHDVWIIYTIFAEK